MVYCFRLLLVGILSLFTLLACSQSPAPTSLNQAATYNVQLGLGYLQQGNVVSAKQKLLLAQQQAPNDPTVLAALGYFYERTDTLKQAKEYYQQALKLAPKQGAVQNNYGTFLCRQKEYAKALTHFDLAVQDPSYLHTADAYANAGQCAAKLPDVNLAQTYFLKAIANDPKQTTALLELAKLSYNQRNYLAARHYLQRYLQATTAPTPIAQQLALKLQV